MQKCFQLHDSWRTTVEYFAPEPHKTRAPVRELLVSALAQKHAFRRMKRQLDGDRCVRGSARGRQPPLGVLTGCRVRSEAKGARSARWKLARGSGTVLRCQCAYPTRRRMKRVEVPCAGSQHWSRRGGSRSGFGASLGRRRASSPRPRRALTYTHSTDRPHHNIALAPWQNYYIRFATFATARAWFDVTDVLLGFGCRHRRRRIFPLIEPHQECVRPREHRKCHHFCHIYATTYD